MISTHRKEHTLKEMQKAKNLEKVVEEEVEDFGDGYFAGAQQTLWDLFEKPQSSAAAKIMSLARWLTLSLFSSSVSK